MAVTVVKGPPEFTVRQECPGCKAELEATRSDLKVGLFGGMGDYDEEVYFDCPLCESSVKVKVPSALQDKLRSARKKDGR